MQTVVKFSVLHVSAPKHVVLKTYMMLVIILRALVVRKMQGRICFVARNISPVENISVAILTYGEGFHNYHHVFPYDYKTAELGDYVFNPTTAFIDFFARIGWAYSLKTMSKETILKRVARTGDGTHKFSRKSNSTENADSVTDKNHDSNEDHLWGWGDEDMKAEDYKFVSVLGSEDAG